uniref:Density-regulated protein n=1 Tax=Parascaris univalens TaxID=6257 RepID=A0A914ZWA2_PARUN
MESTETEQKPAISTNGFDPDIKYPLIVQYCGECSMPLEYCEYSGIADRCRKWLEKNIPSELERLQIAGDEIPDAEKKHQKRGGKGSKPMSEKAAASKKRTTLPAKVTLQRAPRGKNKSVTVIKGLATFDVDLKAAAKFFAGRFACGSSVTGVDEIVVQGDVKDDLFDIITEKWPHIDEESIEDLGDQKR